MDFQPRRFRPSSPRAVVFTLAVFAGAGYLGMQAWWGYGSLLRQASAERQAELLEADRADQTGTPETIPEDPTVAEVRWNDYRGSSRDGIVQGPPLLARWPAGGPPRLYRQPVGGGYAAFVIGRGMAFTIEQRRDREVVAAYDLLTGKERWTHSWTALFSERLGGDGPRATPTLAGEWLIAYGAEGDLVCLEANTGALQWRRSVLSENDLENLPWGMAGSPLVSDGRVLVTTSGMGGGGVRAYRMADGKPLWSAVPEQQGYSSLVAVTLAGRKQILNLAGEGLLGLDPETGAILWRFPWETSMKISVGQPLQVGEDQVYISTGYGKGAALIEVQARARGFETRAVWTSLKMKNKFTSSVIHQKTAYGLDEGVLAALDLKTGQRLWKGKRYGHGQILLAGDQILVLGDDGFLALVRANPKRFEELSGFKALEGRTWNNPAIAGGILLVRNDREMTAFDLRAR